MSGHTVRQQFLRQFRGLETNPRHVSALIVAGFILQATAAMGFGYWLLQYPLTVPSGFGLALVVLFIGTRLRALNNIVHECSHFTFTERRQDNVFFGRLCASLVLGCFKDYRDEHMTHHAHLGDYEQDLDLQGIQAYRLEEPLTPRTILRHAVTPLLGLHLPHYFGVNLTARDGSAWRALKIGLIAAAVLCLVLDPLAALLLVWVPYAWVYTAINYWTDCIDHGGLVQAEDELDASRNVPVPKQLRALLFPRNDCYHLIHHLFPQVPSDHFDACHDALLKNPEYRARAAGPEGDTRAPAREPLEVVNRPA